MELEKVKFLQRLIADESPGRAVERRAGVCSTYFLEAHRIGTLSRLTITYNPSDIAHAKALLGAHGMPIMARRHAEKSDRAAISVLPGVCDKSANVSPHTGQVALKALTSGCMHHGLEISPSLPGHLVVHKDEALAIQADALLVVENLETFQQISRYRWIFDTELSRLRVLVLFRGDHVTKCDAMQSLLHARKEPVWSFPDLDPAGLGLASQLPRLSGLLLPWGRIEALLRERRMSSLFDNQIKQWAPTLRACAHPSIQRAWQLIERLGLGLNQEALRDLH